MRKLILGVVSASALFAVNAQADEYSYMGNGRPWDLTVGAAVIYVPEFKGSDQTTTWTLPYVQAKYRLNAQDSLFLNMSEGLGYKHKVNEAVSVGILASYRKGRESEDDNKLIGMEDLDSTAEVGAFAKFNHGYASYSAKYMKGIGSNDGGYLELGAMTSRNLAQKLKGSIGISTVYADGEYMNDYYTVSVGDATASRPAYDADSGFRDVSFSGHLLYSYDEHHKIMTTLGYGMLLGDAKDSSIVSDENFVTAVIGYGYKF